MRIETDVIQVKNDPKIINEVNEEAAIWGWSVLNIQITDHKIVKEGDSHGRESAWGDKYIITTEVITEHISYATITYQRDLDDPTTKKLVDLEKAYVHANTADLLNDSDREAVEGLNVVLNKKERDKLLGKLLLIATGICFVLALFGVSVMEYVMYACLAGSLFFYGKAIFTPQYRICQKNYDHIMKNLRLARIKRKEEILKEAKEIHTA